MRTLALGLAAALLALGASGCGLLQNPIDPTHGLEQAQKRFSRLLRWGEWRRASEYVAPEGREAFLETTEALEEVRLTGYEVLSLDIGEEARTATARVRFTGHPLAMPVERSVELVERWERPEEAGRWQVEVELSRLSRGLRTASR